MDTNSATETVEAKVRRIYVRRLGLWLDRKFSQLLRIDVYTVSDGEVVRAKGFAPTERLRLDTVKSWQVHPEMGFDSVVINLGSEEFCWIDRYDDLIAILRNSIPELELSA